MPRSAELSATAAAIAELYMLFRDARECRDAVCANEASASGRNSTMAEMFAKHPHVAARARGMTAHLIVQLRRLMQQDAGPCQQRMAGCGQFDALRPRAAAAGNPSCLPGRRRVC